MCDIDSLVCKYSGRISEYDMQHRPVLCHVAQSILYILLTLKFTEPTSERPTYRLLQGQSSRAIVCTCGVCVQEQL